MRINSHRTPAILSRRATLLAGLGFFGCGREGTHQRVDPALGPLIPSDTTTLVGIRLDHLRKTPAWKQLFPDNAPSVLDGLAKKSGIDVKETVHEVLYCLGGRHRCGLIRGKFVDEGPNNSGMEPQLKMEGAQKFPYKGFTLIGKEEFAATFFNSSVVALGNAAAIRAIIDNNERKNAVPQALLNMVQALPVAANVYAVSTSPSIPEGGVGGVRSLPLTLKSAWAYADLTTTASIRAEGEGTTAEDAKKLVDAFKALTSLLRMTLKPAQKQMLTVLDSLQVVQDNAKVKLQADLPLETVLDLLKGIDLSDKLRA
ncbi:hypothetical protein [Bryobacter aggregatus]|uniref:hypothetical protein n=1 Tax=Bryobacter aggregatus TaxID=360054 RepID=UPI0012BA8F9E|nr:hypothetical protein [Bryobacter aggregatus]